MKAADKTLLALTAGDLMTGKLVLLPETMPLHQAAHILVSNQISGAPVVDGGGRCVGILSAADFLRMGDEDADPPRQSSPSLRPTCSFQIKQRTADGKTMTYCSLPPGVCPIQVKQTEPGNDALIVCGQPRCALADWQVIDPQRFPVDEVRQHMTSDPVTVLSTTSIRALARTMIDAHIHRIVVVDENRMPIGIVTSTDLLAAVAYARGEPAESPWSTNETPERCISAGT